MCFFFFLFLIFFISVFSFPFLPASRTIHRSGLAIPSFFPSLLMSINRDTSHDRGGSSVAVQMKMERSKSSRADYSPNSSLVYGGLVPSPLPTFLASSSLPSVSLPTSVRSSCQANRCRGYPQQRPSLFDILSPPTVVMAHYSSNDRSVTASVRVILTKRIDQVRNAATRNSTA